MADATAPAAAPPTDLQNFELGAAGAEDALLHVFGIDSQRAAAVYSEQTGTDLATVQAAETDNLLDQAGILTAQDAVNHPIDTLAGGVGTAAGAAGQLAGESLAKAKAGLVSGFASGLGIPTWGVYLGLFAILGGAGYLIWKKI